MQATDLASHRPRRGPPRRTRSPLWAALASAALCVGALSAGCWRSDAPGDSGVEPAEAPVEVGGRVYEKPEGVFVDIPRLIGRSLDSIDGTELEVQLGLLLGEERLPGLRGIQRTYQNGTIRVATGLIYYVAHTYEVPLNRVLALQTVGFPGSLSPMSPRSLQFRFDRPTHKVRRIALQRAEMNSELVTKIEVWSALPTEAF